MKGEAIKEALQVVLDCVDYTASNCAVNDMVGAVLPREVIAKARQALMEEHPECKQHPRYKGLRKPTADCEVCRLIWASKNMAKLYKATR